MDLKNSQINKICHFANHPYLCKGLIPFLKNNNTKALIIVLLW
ncbi:hypothetical protein MNB_SUP05-SYMBIONT-7-28 [hydrothermal vent metagenome]|uniref:Uncharacterized protein n=1 Tax=hydrothermal vent metagenome TaxID=652676 RepID=A0A1W1E6G5_9ZZZZ